MNEPSSPGGVLSAINPFACFGIRPSLGLIYSDRVVAPSRNPIWPLFPRSFPSLGGKGHFPFHSPKRVVSFHRKWTKRDSFVVSVLFMNFPSIRWHCQFIFCRFLPFFSFSFNSKPISQFIFFMIWRRFDNSSDQKSGQSFGRFDAMSSSELPTMANIQSQSPSTGLETRPEIGNEAARLGKMVIRPSQPIDICRGPSQQRIGHPHHLQKLSAQRLSQRSASEMAPTAQKCPSVVFLAPPTAQKGHQPRVIQPRRLATNIGNGTTNAMPIIGTGEGAGDDGQTKNGGLRASESERQNGTAHKRSRGFTVDIPPSQPKNSQRTEQNEGTKGGPNKENSEGARNNSSTSSSSSKSSRNSRKRLNSLELGNMDYDALEGTSSAEAKAEKHQQKGIETKEVTSESKQREKNGDQTTDKNNGTVRRKAEGGRIAYLYGVYGANSDASATEFSARDCRTRQHRRSAFADQANTLGYGGMYWDDCCCLEEEDKEAETDDELFKMTRGCLVHSLHTVSDIIGYAKVVRAQRNETLGRLNDVMTQFDALIRSYSVAMKNGTNIPRQIELSGGGGGDSANGTLQGQTQLEPAA